MPFAIPLLFTIMFDGFFFVVIGERIFLPFNYPKSRFDSGPSPREAMSEFILPVGLFLNWRKPLVPEAPDLVVDKSLNFV